MEIFEAFNFDIIIILILLASVMAGLYYSLYRQSKKTLIIVIPFVILFFIFNEIMKIFNQIKFITSIRDSVFDFLKINSYKNITTAIIVYIVSFLVIAFLVRVLLSVFNLSVQRQVMNKPKSASRLLGGLLGLLNGYLIIMILMFGVKPFIDVNYDRPITSLLNETSNEFITLTELNECQNVNVEKFNDYDLALNYLTGRKALDGYNEILNFISSIPLMNQEIQDKIVPILSVPSLQLLNSSDYVSALLSEADGKVVINTIIKNEKDNQYLSLIKELNKELINKQGYIYLKNKFLTNDINTYNYDDIYNILASNQDEIANQFSDLRSRNHFKEIVEAGKFYQEYQSTIKTLLEDENITDLQSYVNSFETILTNKELLNNFASKFKESLKDSDNKIISINIDLFSIYIKYKDKISLIDFQMPFSARVILGKHYSKWFTNKIWEEQYLIHSYLIDAISSSTVSGNHLYHQYIFYTYLSNNVTFTDDFDINDMNTVFTNIDEMVQSGLLSENEAIRYIDNLFLYSNSAFNDLVRQDKVSDTFITELLNVNNVYLSDNVKTILGS